MATVTNTNGISRSGSGNGPRTRIINLNKSNMTEAELSAALNILRQVMLQALTMLTQSRQWHQ